MQLSQQIRDAGAEAAQDVPDVAQALSTVLRWGNLPRTQEQLIRAAGLKLDRASYWLLRLLSDHEWLRVSELAHRQGTDVSTACRQISRCEQEGLVRREVDPSDMRAVLFTLTDRGRDALKRLQAVRLELFDRVLADWPAEDRHEFARLLVRFAGDYVRAMTGRQAEMKNEGRKSPPTADLQCPGSAEEFLAVPSCRVKNA